MQNLELKVIQIMRHSIHCTLKFIERKCKLNYTSRNANGSIQSKHTTCNPAAHTLVKRIPHFMLTQCHVAYNAFH